MPLLSSQPSRSHHPAFVLSGPRAGRRPGTALPPGSELPPSPCRGRRSRAPTRRGRAWTTAGACQHTRCPMGTATRRGSLPGEPPSKRLKTEVLGSAGWAYTWLPAQWGGASCRGPALSQHKITDGPFFLWAEETVAIVSPPPPPLHRRCWGLGLGASVGVGQQRGAGGGRRARSCLGLRYLLPKSALGLDPWVAGPAWEEAGRMGPFRKLTAPSWPPGPRREERAGRL